MGLPAGLLADFSEGLYKVLAIHIIQEDILTPVSTAHDVVEGAWIFDSQLAWHQNLLPALQSEPKQKMNQTMD